MNRNKAFRFAALLGVSAAVVAPTWAQQQAPPPAATPAPAGAAGQQQPAATNGRTLMLESVLSNIGKAANVVIVADSSVARQQVTPPAEATTAENFSRQIEALVQQLGRGATWAKMYLPAARSARGYNADALADYALAQARLYGNVGGATPAGTVEIMGQNVPADRAESVITTLNLKPVYLVTNPQARAAASVPAGGDVSAQWGTMTEEQRRAYAAQQAQQIMGMDPNARRAYLQQMMRRDTPERMIMREMMRNLTPEQRREFFQGGGGRGGFGGPDGGRRGGGNR